jgi:hypothetical protein
MTRKLEPEEVVVGEVLESSRPGVADFLLPIPFNDLNPGMGIVGSGSKQLDYCCEESRKQGWRRNRDWGLIDKQH